MMRLAIVILFFRIGTIYADVKEQIVELLVNTNNVETPTNFSTKCFDGLGCYNDGPPFYDPVVLPLSLLPLDNPKENIEFLLFTPHNKEDRQSYTFELTEESLKKSHFSPDGKTMVWIHGWQPKLPYSDELFRVKDALLEHTDDYKNFFAVKWANYVGDSYEQALSNGRVVGNATAKMIEFLMNHTNATKQSFHVVGHSVGGQIIAYVGQELPGLYRLTALDASQYRYLGAHKDVRLDASDANFVDTIHANGGYNLSEGLGYPESYGHQDFYPNGGRKQPGCINKDTILKNATNNKVLQTYLFESCDHGRSVDYFLESIISGNCTFKGTLCESYDDWKEGKCLPNTHEVAIMGLRAKPIPGLPPSKFYLYTRPSQPYCKRKGHKRPKLFSEDL